MFVRCSSSALLMLLLISLSGNSAFAAPSGPILTLVPHCTEVDRTACPVFTALDGTRLTTPLLKAGDILDIDIEIHTDAPRDLSSVHSWLTYNTTMLTARAVEPSPLLTAPFPGERDIDTSKGLVKIGGDITLPSGTPQTRFAIARVTFRINEQAQTSALSFHDFSIGGFGKTSIQGNEILTGSNEKDGNTLLAPPPCIGNILGCQEGGETSVKLPLLRIQPPSLVINTGTPTGAANITINLTHTAPTLEEKTKIALSNDSALAPPVDAARLTRPDTVIAATVPNTLTSSSNTSLSSSAQQGQTPAAPNALFPLLQIQNLRVTTQGRNLLVAWQPLGSSALKGYNVYYGTVSGQYIQRRSIPISPPSLTIRDLEPNTQYFVAVRGFAEGNTETAFTQEASVIIGKPETASSPLITSGEDLTSPENPLEVRERTIISGESGPTSTLLLFLFLSACIGTALAARRSSFYE